MEKLSVFRQVAILIFLVIFAALSYGAYSSMKASYSVWEIVIVIALIWLGYLILVYIITYQESPDKKV